MSRKQLAGSLHTALEMNRRLNTMVMGLLLEYGDDTGKCVVLKSTFALLEPGDFFSMEPQDKTQIVLQFHKEKK